MMKLKEGKVDGACAVVAFVFPVYGFLEDKGRRRKEGGRRRGGITEVWLAKVVFRNLNAT